MRTLSYRRLNLRLGHDAYPEEACPDARIVAESGSAALLRRWGVNLRQLPDGLSLLVPIGTAGRPGLALVPGVVLKFLICECGTAFSQVTEWPGPKRSLASPPWSPPFDGQSADRVEFIRFPHAIRRAGADPLVGCLLLRPAAAWIAEFGAPGAPATRELRLSLPARALKWRYYCVLPAGTHPDAVAIVHTPGVGDPRADSPPIEFETAVASPDRVVARLRAWRPGTCVVACTSRRVVAVRARARAGLSLRLDGATLIEALPSPRPDCLLRLEGAAGDAATLMAFRTVDASTIP